jgi:chromosome segregation ATPase
MTQPTDAPAREDTMIYRLPAADSVETAIQEIWGKRLEVRVVDSPEVADLLKEGWVTHPLDLDKPSAPQSQVADDPIGPEGAPTLADEMKAKDDAIEAAEQLIEALTKERDALTSDLKDMTVERDVRKDEVAELKTKLAATEDERDKALEDLKAAEALLAEPKEAGKPPATAKKQGS